MDNDNVQNFDFDPNLNLSDFFDNIEQKKQVEKDKIQHIFWHEIGHLIGKFISKDLGFDLGKTLKIDFRTTSPHIKNEEVYPPLKIKSFGPVRDYYGEENGTLLDEFDETTKNFKLKKFDINILCPFYLYIFLGGFFNLHINSILKNEPIKNKDFDLIFKNISKKVNYEEIEGCAGDDWRKIKDYCSAFEIPMLNIKTFRLEIFNVLEKYQVFEYFKEEITSTYNKDILLYEDSDLEILENTFEELYHNLSNKNHLINDLKNICEQFTKNNIA
ncbi:hypothetical protein [Chryseobacterium sp. GVT01B]|uniref:hypothetical protein n=1 Tax=Chryseobacterium sp. GVT01B TaxID=2862675 RepID=UPI001CC050D2|nr:hypothetical protein [Chryseobacterium sp. GVT01B]